MFFKYRKAIKKIIRGNRIYNNCNPFHNKIVNDGYYNYLKSQSANTWEWGFTDKREEYNGPCAVKTIIVVLESPHIDEFDENGDGKHPLFNDKNFRDHFDNILNSAQKPQFVLNQSYLYNIYFINTIQYQCSLGLPTEYFRDYVFLYYWERKKIDFISRLQQIIDKVKIENVHAIINCCTKGSHENVTQLIVNRKWKDIANKCDKSFFKQLGIKHNNAQNLNDLVGEEIQSFLQGTNQSILYGTCTHPSSWFEKNNRKLK